MTTKTLDATLTLLSHHQRRWTIQYLRSESGGAVSVDTLVEHLESRPAADSEMAQASNDEVQVELRHVHLPKLVDHDVVEYDDESGTLQYTPKSSVELVLDGVQSGPGILLN